MPVGEKRDTAMIAVADQVAETDPAQAVQMIQGMKNRGAMDQIFSKWADKDVNAATQAALSQLTNPQDRESAMRGIAGKLTGNDPQSAIAWVAQIPAGKLRDAAQDSIASNWAQTDPQAAMTWAEGTAAIAVEEQRAATDRPAVYFLRRSRDRHEAGAKPDQRRCAQRCPGANHPQLGAGRCEVGRGLRRDDAQFAGEGEPDAEHHRQSDQ